MRIDTKKLEQYVRFKRRDSLHFLGTLLFLGFCSISVFAYPGSACAEFISKYFSWLLTIETFLWMFSVGSTASAMSNNLPDPVAKAAQEDELAQLSVKHGMSWAFVSVVLLQAIFAFWFYLYPNPHSHLLMASLTVIVPLFVLNAVTLYFDR